jgi:hypothetical protein
MRRQTARLLTVTAALGLWCGGCSHEPPAPPRQKVDPKAAAQAAMEAYDADHNGVLDAQELEKSPPLKAALERMDTNHDGKLTFEEILARINAWLKSDTILMSALSVVTLDGKPLEDATVTFEPEPFLGPGYVACVGVTDKTGTANPTRPSEQYQGVYPGLYRVRISKKVNGQEIVPARYNTQTILGEEIAADVPRPRRLIIFDLQSQ